VEVAGDTAGCGAVPHVRQHRSQHGKLGGAVDVHVAPLFQEPQHPLDLGQRALPLPGRLDDVLWDGCLLLFGGRGEVDGFDVEACSNLTLRGSAARHSCQSARCSPPGLPDNRSAPGWYCPVVPSPPPRPLSPSAQPHGDRLDTLPEQLLCAFVATGGVVCKLRTIRATAATVSTPRAPITGSHHPYRWLSFFYLGGVTKGLDEGRGTGLLIPRGQHAPRRLQYEPLHQARWR